MYTPLLEVIKNNDMIIINTNIDDISKEIGFDLSSISKDEIIKQFVDFQLIAGDVSYTSKIQQHNGHYINEAENYSVPLNIVKTEISEKYKLQDWQFVIEEGKNKIQIAYIIPFVNKNIEMLTNDMKSYGYHYSKILRKFKLNNNIPFLYIKYEPIYSDNITNHVRETRFIYHITPEYNLDNIKKEGFIPKYNNTLFNYPPRIYFILAEIKYDDAIELVSELYLNNVDKNNNGVYHILTLDMKHVPTNVQFQYDPNFEYGIFTYDKVPYDAVISDIIYKFKK